MSKVMLPSPSIFTLTSIELPVVTLAIEIPRSGSKTCRVTSTFLANFLSSTLIESFLPSCSKNPRFMVKQNLMTYHTVVLSLIQMPSMNLPRLWMCKLNPIVFFCVPLGRSFHRVIEYCFLCTANGTRKSFFHMFHRRMQMDLFHPRH